MVKTIPSVASVAIAVTLFFPLLLLPCGVQAFRPGPEQMLKYKEGRAGAAEYPQQPHHPNHHRGHLDDVPTIAPYSLTSACAAETRDLCELRTPFGQRAIECFERHRKELSPVCGAWHEARMQCKMQLESSSFEHCPDCRRFCGKGMSLMHCIRAAGSRISVLGVDERCTDTPFFRSMSRHYKRVNQFA